MAVLALTGLMVVPLTRADNQNAAFRKAKGTYDVTLSATGNAPGFGRQRAGGYPGVLRLPNKRGKLVLRARVEGRNVVLPGQITSTKVRRNGNVVTFRGVTRIPPSALNRIPADIRSQDPDDLIDQIPAEYRSLIPNSLLEQFRRSGFEGVAGSLTASFRSTVNVRRAKPRVTATAQLSLAGAGAKAKAVGVHR